MAAWVMLGGGGSNDRNGDRDGGPRLGVGTGGLGWGKMVWALDGLGLGFLVRVPRVHARCSTCPPLLPISMELRNWC